MNTGDSRLLHLFWIGEETPSFISSNFSLWKEKFKGEVRIWNNSNIEPINTIAGLQSMWPKAMLVDLLRVIAVSLEGGWYCDADSVPGDSDLPFSNKITFVREESKRFCNGFFFSPKGHPFLAHWIIEIENSIKVMWPHSSFIPEVSGPHALSRAIYTYALSVGAVNTRENLDFAPWGSIEFLHSKDVPNRKTAGRTAIHIAQSSWDKSEKLKISSPLRTWLYKSRQGRYASILDFVRNILRHPHLRPTTRSELRMFINTDNYILDSIKDWSDVWFTLENEELLYEVIRNLRICGIETQNHLVAEKLSFAGWVKIDKSHWIRPKVTNLVSLAQL